MILLRRWPFGRADPGAVERLRKWNRWLPKLKFAEQRLEKLSPRLRRRLRVDHTATRWGTLVE